MADGIERNFYLLKAIDFDNGAYDNPFRVWWDCMYSVVVLATNEDNAREFAGSVAGIEGMDTWLNPDYTTCEIITTDTSELGIVCSDIRLA